MKKLALIAAFVVHSLWENARQQLPANFFDHPLNFFTQLRRERHLCPSPWRPVPDMAVGNFDIQHLLKAYGLGAELQIGSVAMPYSGLVLNRMNAVVVVDLDRVSPTG